MVVAGFRIKK